jgi:hypothetical protein
MQVKGGFRSPEDLRKTPFNPSPNPKQLEPNDYAARSNSPIRNRGFSKHRASWWRFHGRRALLDTNARCAA